MLMSQITQMQAFPFCVLQPTYTVSCDGMSLGILGCTAGGRAARALHEDIGHALSSGLISRKNHTS